MRGRWQTPVAILIAVVMTPTTALAQRDEAVRWTLWSSWSVELHAGVSNYGRFLLQVVDGPDGIVGQRALHANHAFSAGGSLGTMILPRTGIRLAFNHTFPTDLDYRDDTGLGTAVLDIDGIARLRHTVVSLEAIRFILPERSRLSPYGAAGMAVGWWNLSDTTDLILAGGGSETQLRWGGVGAVGMQYRARDNMAVRLEATTYGTGNPFTGRESYVPTTGVTITELTHVRQTVLRLGIAYTFGRSGRN